MYVCAFIFPISDAAGNDFTSPLSLSHERKTLRMISAVFQQLINTVLAEEASVLAVLPATHRTRFQTSVIDVARGQVVTVQKAVEIAHSMWQAMLFSDIQ